MTCSSRSSRSGGGSRDPAAGGQAWCAGLAQSAGAVELRHGHLGQRRAQRDPGGAAVEELGPLRQWRVQVVYNEAARTTRTARRCSGWSPRSRGCWTPARRWPRWPTGWSSPSPGRSVAPGHWTRCGHGSAWARRCAACSRAAAWTIPPKGCCLPGRQPGAGPVVQAGRRPLDQPAGSRTLLLVLTWASMRPARTR